MFNCLSEDAKISLGTPKYTLATVYLYFKYCNLKCRHCWINPPHSGGAALREGEMSLGGIVSALEECRELGMKSVKITGGEPFTSKDIFGLLEYLKKNNIRIYMETNGALVRGREARALKEARVSQVAVSLDGPTADIHESLRGVSGSFADTVEGVKALKRENLNIQIITCLWKGNGEKIRATIMLAKELGASSVKINPVHGISRAGTMDRNGETLSVKEVIDFYHSLTKEPGEILPIKVIFDIPPAFRPVSSIRRDRIGTCSIFNILGILGDGRVSICGIGSVVDTMVLGKAGEDRIKDIWECHPVLKRIREDVPGKMEGICGRCMFKSYCLGKCRAEAYYSSGSIRAPLGFCQTAYEEGLFPKSRMIC